MKSIIRERARVLSDMKSRDIKASIIPNNLELSVEKSRGYNLRTIESHKPSDKKYSSNNIVGRHYRV